MVWERQVWLKHSFSTPLEDKMSSWFIRVPFLSVYDYGGGVQDGWYTQDDKRRQVSTWFLIFYVLFVTLGHIWSFRIFSYNNVSFTVSDIYLLIYLL